MCDRIKVILKSLVTEKNSLMSIWKIIYTAIGYISSVFTFAVLIKDMMSIDAFELLCKKFLVGININRIFSITGT